MKGRCNQTWPWPLRLRRRHCATICASLSCRRRSMERPFSGFWITLLFSRPMYVTSRCRSNTKMPAVSIAARAFAVRRTLSSGARICHRTSIRRFFRPYTLQRTAKDIPVFLPGQGEIGRGATANLCPICSLCRFTESFRVKSRIRRCVMMHAADAIDVVSEGSVSIQRVMRPVTSGFQNSEEERIGAITLRSRTLRSDGGRCINDLRNPAPVLAVKLQELFGLTETPRIGDGRIPLTLHLLSPAGRPVKITNELRWRYPNHPWPEDPLSAVPTRKSTIPERATVPCVRYRIIRFAKSRSTVR